jgi:hypothetical protein
MIPKVDAGVRKRSYFTNNAEQDHDSKKRDPVLGVISRSVGGPEKSRVYRALLGAADEVGWPYHSARGSLVGRNASSANHQLVPRPGDEQDLERTKLGDEQAKCPVAVGFIEVIANSCSARSKLGLGQRMGRKFGKLRKASIRRFGPRLVWGTERDVGGGHSAHQL